MKIIEKNIIRNEKLSRKISNFKDQIDINY